MPPHSTQADPFTPRLTTPRLEPLAPEDRNEAQRAMLAKRADYNIYKTLAHHLEFVRAFGAIGGFTFQGSSLPPREREIIMLRMGWLCQAEYEWSQHARIAKSSAGLTDGDLHRIAEGPAAPGWSDFEASLLRMVDELRHDAMISDVTWPALHAQYSDQRIMEALFTAAQYQLVSMMLNSLGIQLDPGLQDRLPRDLPLPAPAARPTAQRLVTPRIKALTEAEMTPEQRDLVKPQARNGAVPNLYATMANHPKLYGPRLALGRYLQRGSLLPPKARELLILRTAWNIRAEYEWSHHVEAAKAAGFTDTDVARIVAGPSASGWSEEHAALLRAADELRREAFISDATWQTLLRHYDMKQMIDIVGTVGGYTMTGLAINSFGIQAEPGYPAMPKD
ncbi:carboxymuconolactone decarboxylase family protein [Bradyrhizobium sp. GCM10027634]|uniref:carboxymuconolactone decarboxylase family protein n=1 Tax=unclassified Bradyrhizobium TaxID=2631580 RepID=UPI00188A3F5E|nr:MULTISPECIES: carboxymuconolactone decarboxylase family protein [unclassified Bradyrhizobium]MDN5004331.1 carboxymuconolactone decarboxylase family protein [Bradyrhizobium sp. WYCCWR 12677]QOZ46996.1 hypothetical protein XH89_28595 [Bradyrhizobium sp. CCBAU 53340]